MNPPVATVPEIDALLAARAPVAIGVSGGKDSQAAAIATIAYLDQVGHTGPRILIHADLGMVEWGDSKPACERLAEHLDIGLVEVSRPAGGMMERWESRWESSKRRYAALETVTLVLPWSTPSMRFCTSELKTQVIGSDLRKRFPGQTVINVTGVRREESSARAKATVAGADAKNAAWNWRPIVDWKLADVFKSISDSGLALHNAYTEFGMSRVSCRWCIMSNGADLVAASTDPSGAPVYRRMVQLEIDSTFGFQGTRWLADVAPHLLGPGQREAVVVAKAKAAQRIAIEATIPKHLLYVKGWPTAVPSDADAELLAGVRRQMGDLFGLPVLHADGPSIQAHYAELMAVGLEKSAVKKEKADRSEARAARKAAADMFEEPDADEEASPSPGM